MKIFTLDINFRLELNYLSPEDNIRCMKNSSFVHNIIRLINIDRVVRLRH